MSARADFFNQRSKGGKRVHGNIMAMENLQRGLALFFLFGGEFGDNNEPQLAILWVPVVCHKLTRDGMNAGLVKGGFGRNSFKLKGLYKIELSVLKSKRDLQWPRQSRRVNTDVGFQALLYAGRLEKALQFTRNGTLRDLFGIRRASNQTA